MKKLSILALALLASSAFAYDFSVGAAGSSAVTGSQATAGSTGNGTAFSGARGGQLANSGTMGSSSATGSAVGGFAETAGFADSVSTTTGSGIAGSAAHGSASSDSIAVGASGLFQGGPSTLTAGTANSSTNNFAGTASAGNGHAYAANETTNFSQFGASASATQQGNLITLGNTSFAQSDSTEQHVNTSTGNALGFQNSTNGGNAWSFSNAAAQ